MRSVAQSRTISKLVREGRVAVVGALYDLRSANLDLLDAVETRGGSSWRSCRANWRKRVTKLDWTLKMSIELPPFSPPSVGYSEVSLNKLLFISTVWRLH